MIHQKESTVPYDYDDVLALIAGRPCLIYSPARDRFVDPEDVKSCVEKARKSLQGAGALTFEQPDDICRFQSTQQDVLVRWLETAAIREES